MSKDKKIELGAWILFVISSIFYIVSNFISGQFVALAGSVFFFLACIVFIVVRFWMRR